MALKVLTTIQGFRSNSESFFHFSLTILKLFITFAENSFFMKKQFAIVLLLISLVFAAIAQKNEKILHGVILDEHETRISEACISDDKGMLIDITNYEGVFQIPLNRKYNITISHPRFKKATIPVDPKDFELIDGKYYAIFMMEDKSITSNFIDYQDTITRKEYVVDYKVSKYGIFMIKTDGIHSKLQQISYRNKVIASQPIDMKFNQVYIDALNGIHIYSNDSSYNVYSDGAKISLNKGHDFNYFISHIMSLSAVTDSIAVSYMKYYYGQSIDYILTNLNTQNQDILCTIDSETAKYEGSSAIGELTEARRFWRSLGYEAYSTRTSTDDDLKKRVSYKERLSIKEVYAPIINIDNNLYVFDFPSDFIIKYDNVGAFINNIEIGFHLSHGRASKFYNNPFDNNIIFDPIKKECWAQFRENGKVTLKKIDLKKGNIIGEYAIEKHDNPLNIQIYNGIVYYLYFENDGCNYEKRYFYAEMIK